MKTKSKTLFSETHHTLNALLFYIILQKFTTENVLTLPKNVNF